MDNFIASKKTLKSVRKIFLKMQKYSEKSCDRIEKYRRKRYEVGQLVYPKDKETFPKQFLNIVFTVASLPYNNGWEVGDVFIISEIRVKPEYHWRVTDKTSGNAEKVLIYIPIYDLVKLDDPAIEIRGSKDDSFTVLS